MGFINEGARRSYTALASATSANGTARNGTSIATNSIYPGSLVNEVAITIVTGSVVATVKHQVSMDNSTFYDLTVPNNPANVTTTATATIAVSAPEGVMSYKYYRPVVTLSGAATAGGDLTAITTRYMSYGDLD